VSNKKVSKDNVLVRLSGLFFRNWRYTLMAWLLLLVFGSFIYARVIQREGFPTIQFPLSIVSGTYFVDDVERVDGEVVQPLYDELKGIEEIDKVSTNSGGNFFSAQIEFRSGVEPVEGSNAVQSVIDNSATLPPEANFNIITIDPAAFLNEYDMLLSVYSRGVPSSVDRLESVARFVAEEVAKDPVITEAMPQFLTDTGQNPVTGQTETRQTKFNQIGLKQDGGAIEFFPAVTIGVDRDKEQLDVIELSELMRNKLAGLDLSQFSDSETSYEVVIGADFAESIETQISSLQSNLVTGLIAVAIVSLLLITWRASIITGIFMVTVMATTVLVLYVVGYSLNTITLFALVLSLGLFVDDATIVVESIEANKKKKLAAKEVVRTAIRKIGAASFAGTFTTVLVFLPLAFLSGILGEFIRLMPITIIIALITSLVLSLTVIPLLSRFFLLRSDSKDWLTRVNPVSMIEGKMARGVGELPRLLKTHPTLGKFTASLMVLLSIGFLVGSGFYANKLSFNIFPPTKDSDQIGFTVRYPEGFSLQQAEAVADDINQLVADEVGDDAVRVTYGSFSQPNARSADALIELTPFDEREVKSPELIDRLQARVDEAINDSISVRVLQFDAGPPVDEFPLAIQVTDEDIERATKLAQEIQNHIQGAVIERPNGTTATIIEMQPLAQQSISRVDGKRTLSVRGAFDDDDVSALLSSAESYVTDKFTPEYLSDNGYPEDVLGFDFGQETENADSFASLVWAFPLALLLMYILLSLQFRSMLQPLLIFMAIPFTFFGVTLGLYLTDNPLSFFVQVGLIGLIGIAVNNTILLTDYANQERRAGLGKVDAISNAATKRFRPLVTTTLTTIVALLPLALSDPFWEALAITIIFGLASSTILVILSFPYYYLAAEWLRDKTRRKKKATT